MTQQTLEYVQMCYDAKEYTKYMSGCCCAPIKHQGRAACRNCRGSSTSSRLPPAKSARGTRSAQMSCRSAIRIALFRFRDEGRRDLRRLHADRNSLLVLP